MNNIEPENIKNFKRENERIIKTTLENILDLISCADDYGFADDVLFVAFRDMLDGQLSEDEIERYARYIESIEGYNEEDYEEIKEKLKNFKRKYIK